MSLIAALRQGWLRSVGRLRTLASFTIVQALSQAAMMLAGFVVARGTRVDDYAYYTSCVGVLGVVSVVVEGGVNNAMLTLSRGKRSDYRFQALVLKAALAWRWRLVVGAGLIGVCFAGVLIWRLGATNAEIGLYCFFSILWILASTDGLTHLSALRLREDFRSYQTVAVVATFTRVVLTVVLFLGFHAPAWWAVALMVIAFGVQGFLARRRLAIPSAPLRDGVQEYAAIRGFHKAFRERLVKLLPINAVVALQGQFVLFVIGALGDSANTAMLGALTRYALIFTVASSSITVVVAPMIAHGAGSYYRSRIVSVLGLVTLGFVMCIALIYAFRGDLVRLLGNQYAGFGDQLVIISAGGALTALVAIGHGLTEGVGWIGGTWAFPLTALAVNGLLLAWLDLSDPTSVAWFFVAQAVPGLVVLARRVVNVPGETAGLSISTYGSEIG